MRYLISATCMIALSCGLLLSSGARVLRAADAPIDLSDAIEAAKAAKSEFQPISDEKFAASRAALQSAMSELDRWLSADSMRKAKGWKRYLKWEMLETQLAEGENASGRELESVLTQFIGAETAGLELSRFAATRDALRKFIDTLYVKATPKVETHYQAQLDALVASLEAYTADPGADAAAAIGGRLDYLERTGQALHVVEAIRSRFDGPNLEVRASQEFLVAGLERHVDLTAPIRDNIMGTAVYGTGRTTGSVTGRLIPNDEAATIELQLTGVNRSRNVGYNGPVKIYSTGLTHLSAAKQIVIDKDGIHDRPAWARARTNTNIYRISAKCKLIERAAWRRAGKQEGKVESVAAQHARQRVASTFSAEVRSNLAEAEEKYDEQFRKPLLRKNEFPQRFQLSSTAEALMLTAMKANGAQLGAPTPAPTVAPGVDLSVRMHESMAGNMSEGIIGGMKLTDERLAEILEKQTGEVPEELQITQDKEPWSITFERRQPVAVVFGDDSIRIAVRGSEFTRGDTELKQAMEMSATYALEKTATGSKLTRQGDVEVTFLRTSGRLGIRQVAFKTFMRRKFSALFKEEFVGEGLELPGRLKQRGKMQLAQLDSGGGWIALGWNLPAEVVGAE